MKKRLLPACILLAAAPALGQFEGTLELKMTGAEGVAGTMTSRISPVGARTEMDMKAPEGRPGAASGMKFVSIMKFANPDVAYIVNDASKTYSVVDSKKLREQTVPQAAGESWTVKKLGEDKVAGFACTNARFTSGSGSVVEMCLTPDILGGGTFLRDLQRRSRGSASLAKAMKEAGVEGWFPIRTVTKDKEGKATMTAELVSAKKGPVPASTFEIPAGYTESQMGPAGAMMSPEQQKALQEQMKNMTPEQRRQMEQMMKGNKPN